MFVNFLTFAFGACNITLILQLYRTDIYYSAVSFFTFCKGCQLVNFILNFQWDLINIIGTEMLVANTLKFNFNQI